MITCSNCGFQIEGMYNFCPSCGTKVVAAPEAETSLVGKTLKEKYRILSEIGSGAMGTVYLAEHISLKKKVAIKALRPGLNVREDSLKRFQREGIAAGKFNHPNAIQIFDFDRTDDETFFLAMEFVEGTTLKALIRNEGRLPLDTAMDITFQILRALDEAHRSGIVHRDLKPDNIMIVSNNSGIQGIKVLDFGLSKLVDIHAEDSIQTQAGRLLGSPRYMAPEQCLGGAVDHRIDLYAAGLILFEMISGKPPEMGNNLSEIIMKRISEPAPLLSEQHPELQLPTGLDGFIQTALMKDPHARFQSAAEMITALEDVRGSDDGSSGIRQPIPVRPAAVIEANARPAKRLSVPAIAGVSLAIAVIAVLIFVLTGGGSPGASGALPLLSLKSAGDRTEIENLYVTWIEEARNRMAAREFDEALVSAAEAVRMECADAEAFLVRGSIYRERGDLDMARADLEEALRMQEGYAAAAAGLGWVALREEDHEAALERFDQAAGMDAKCAEALVGRGAARYRLGDGALARTALESALAIDASLSLAHYYLGMTLLDEGDLDKAVEEFIQAKRHDINAPEPYLGLGETYLRRGETDQAERQFLEALQLDSDALDARIALASLLMDKRNFAEARPILEDGIQRHANSGKLHVLLGMALHAASQDDRAIVMLCRGVELAPGDAGAMALLGILLQRKGDFAEALDQFQAASEITRYDALPCIGAGLALFALERFDEAGEAFEKAASLDSKNAFSHYNLGVLYMDYYGQADEAVDHFEQFEALGGMERSRNQKVRRWLEGRGVAPPAEAGAVQAQPAADSGSPYDRALLSALAPIRTELERSSDIWTDHSSWDNAWEVRSGPFVVRTTHSRWLGLYVAESLEIILGEFTDILMPGAPTNAPMPVYILPDLTHYNQFGEEHGEHHSSIYGSFHAAGHPDRPVAVLYNENTTLLVMSATHSALHQFVARNFPQRQPPTWISEGLASYFAVRWAYSWSISELEQIIYDNRYTRLRELMQSGIEDYGANTHARFTELGMFFYYLLHFREETKMTETEDGAFVEYLRAALRGGDTSQLAFQRLLNERLGELEADFVSFSFPE